MSTKIAIRTMLSGDQDSWLRMRIALWPDEPLEDHTRAMERLLASPDEWAFIVETAGKAIAFAEVSIRKNANGCESQPVPFLEGIWVDPRHRREGIGEALLSHVERFVTARGFREIGSDALIDNALSLAAHAKWGFTETERVVCFRKVLDG